MQRWLALFLGWLSIGSLLPAQTEKIEYARDIQPILSAHCFSCHGFDPATVKAGLRLDQRDLATRKLRSGNAAIVPGDPQHSSLIERIFAPDASERMPPTKTGKVLKDHEKALLKKWIEQGAEYQNHWSFVVPKRPELPKVKDHQWARTSLDRFILASLEKEGVKPTSQADRYTLARRVALDLTGLPPRLEMVDRFIQDTRPDAYERYVDEVLALPAFGERWAQVWLDLARYADSNGYAEDQPRVIWKFRDWVIQAINKNLPFDQFTIEQIAGDLLPNPSNDQLTATAFHRNTLTNTEGGTNDEEFRNIAVVDRVNTTFQVWMGITISCAQCHNHKYDPISQEEYFQVFALFNQSEDNDQRDNSPNLMYLSPEDARKKAIAEAEIQKLEAEVKGKNPKIDEEQAQWEKEVAGSKELLAKQPANIQAILKQAAPKRKAEQKNELTSYFRMQKPNLQVIQKQIDQVQAELAKVQPVPVPIMKELPEGRKRVTKIHIRGDWLNLGPVVQPGLPTSFHPLPKGEPMSRLGLAKWLVSPDNPLTARVAVNRFWEQIFGTGLVETPEDFGIRSKPPIHPELLDWLAVEFSQSQRWDVKKFIKMLVTSATYRQSSKMTPDLAERDPDNRLFARGPRYRSSAEVIRDQALSVAGLLSPKMYGPSVRPPQPKFGLNAAFGPGTDWTTSTGEDKYRRGLYTYWRRTTPYPSMVAFDAPNRTVCSVTRPRTNTPLQALVTLNDPVYIEAAQALARRMYKEGGGSAEERIRHAFRLTLIRPPQEIELRRLVHLFEQAKKDFAQNSQAALQMATDPLGPLPAGLDPVELAAYTVLGNVLFNLDETFARP